MLNFISAGVGALLLLAGVLGMIFPRVRAYFRMIPFGNPQLWSVIFIGVGFFAGGFGVITSYLDVGSITSDNAVATIGGLTLKIHDGLANATTTEDYYNDADTFLTFYSADANIADGEEYVWNITIERDLVAEDGSVKVSCSVPDKEISGVTADSIAEKTGGQIDLDINDGGRHTSDNVVEKSFAMTEGDNDLEIQVAFDHEETYHDGMTDLDDYVDVVCSVTGDDGSSSSVTTRILADS
jgi:hypothetical protein